MKGSSIPPKSPLTTKRPEMSHSKAAQEASKRWKGGGCLETLPLGEKHGGVCPGPSTGPRCRRQGTAGDSLCDLQEKLPLHPPPGQGPRKGQTNKRTNHPPLTNGETTFPFQQTKWEAEVRNPTQSTLRTQKQWLRHPAVVSQTAGQAGGPSSSPGENQGCGYLPSGKRSVLLLLLSPQNAPKEGASARRNKELSLLPSPAAMRCVRRQSEQSQSPRLVPAKKKRRRTETAQLMRQTETAQGRTHRCSTFPGSQGHWDPVGSWISMLTPQSRARLGNTPIPHSSRISSGWGKQSPTLLRTHKAQGRSGCRAGWHSTPPVSALVVAGSAGNWHYSSNLQEEKVNIQPTNCFYFCCRGPGVWSQGEPSGHVNIHKYPTLSHVNRKSSCQCMAKPIQYCKVK